MHDAHRHLLIAHPPHRFLPRDFAARGGRAPATLLQGFLAEGREVVGLRTTSAVCVWQPNRWLLLFAVMCVVYGSPLKVQSDLCLLLLALSK